MSTPVAVKATRARLLLRDRILLLGVGADARALAAGVDQTTGGIVVVGADARKTVRSLRQVYPNMLLIEQPGVHESRIATPGQPFPFEDEPDPDNPTLFEVKQTLEGYLDAQIRNGATVAMLPAGFVAAEDPTTLTAVVKAANAIDREDVILHLPLSYKWFSGPAGRAKLTMAIQRSKHPVAISMAYKGDPASQPGVPEAIHAVLAGAASNLLLWHSDLGALDALANGALGGAVGVTSSKRHITEPDETAFSPSVHDRSPNVLLPRHLRFGKSQDMSIRLFANGGEPTCDCGTCDGRGLTRFTSSGESVHEAHQHNLAVLTALCRRILTSGDRKACWADLLAEADAAHTATAIETQVMAFKPAGALERWIELNPVPGAAA